MPGNSIGQQFRITTFGESHGSGIGVVIDGCPAGLELDLDFIQLQLQRRRPGQSSITSPRKEDDKPEVLSGVFESKTTGSPLALFIRNKDQRPEDYSHLKEAWRPGHADFTYDQKYGFRDYRGGGRSSARETAARVMAGAVAQLLLKHFGITLFAYVEQVGHIRIPAGYTLQDPASIDSNIVRCPHAETAAQMIALIETTRDEGDTVGGLITAIAKQVPAGLGEPVFHKLQADLAAALMSINAAKAFEIGHGFDSMHLKGSQLNDTFAAEVDSAGHPRFRTLSNHSGGIQGGISNGADIVCRVAFKPVSTLMQNQDSVNAEGKKVVVEGKGRHDPCVLPRAVPIVEAMMALVLADHLLRHRSSRL